MEDHNTTHEVIVLKKFNLNVIRALHPITNSKGKEKKNQRLEKHVQWHHGNIVGKKTVGK